MGGGHTKCMSKRMSTPTGKRAAAPLNPAKSLGHTTALLVALRLDTQKKPRMIAHTGPENLLRAVSVVFDHAVNADGHAEQTDDPNSGHVNQWELRLLAVRHELIDDRAGQEQPDRKNDEQCPCAVHFDFASHIVKMRLPTKQPMAT